MDVTGATAIDAGDFPRLSARTHRFRLGMPHGFRLVGDGSRALFLRSHGGEDAVTALWMSDLRNGGEVLLADPVTLLPSGRETVPDEEKARRERSREQSCGIVSFDVDADGNRAAFALDGDLWTVDTREAEPRRLAVPGPVIDPRISPDGRFVAYSTGVGVHLVEVEFGAVRLLVGAEANETDVSWGLADFIAGEEMDRYHGLWWSPDSTRVLVQRTDARPEPLWHLVDPAHPDAVPRTRRYPRALTHNADVSLFCVQATGPSSGEKTEIAWDRDAYEYLASVSWTGAGAPLALVQSRSQQDDEVLSLDLDSGTTTTLARHHDDAWLSLVGGVPCWTPSGELVTAEVDSRTDTERVAVSGRMLSPAGLQIREVTAVTSAGIVVEASSDPRTISVVLLGYDGSVRDLASAEETPDAVRSAASAGTGLVLTRRDMAGTASHSEHVWIAPDGEVRRNILRNLSSQPRLVPRVRFVTLGEHSLHAAILVPGDSSPWAGAGRLPVLVRPYGGPGAQRVLHSLAGYLEDQWWADQGFVVLVADGRGTPGRGPAWEREMRCRFAEVALQDQVEAVQALEAAEPRADVGRVGIMGWSFGGYLSALAVLRAPDVFRVGVAGAPPTDWALYDTHYTERYLGFDPEVYRANGLLGDAAALRRPLMLIHGFADDNVTVAHTLRLSGALLAAGRAHTVLPLTGITHMAADETVAENLLLVQRDFLRAALDDDEESTGCILGRGRP